MAKSPYSEEISRLEINLHFNLNFRSSHLDKGPLLNPDCGKFGYLSIRFTGCYNAIICKEFYNLRQCFPNIIIKTSLMKT